AWCTVRGTLAARRRDLVSHGRSMRHVVGQMSVAVVSRALMVGFDAAGLDPDLAYVVSLWGPVLAAVAVVELLSPGRSLSIFSWFQHLGGKFREGSALAVRLRIRSLVDSLARAGR